MRGVTSESRSQQLGKHLASLFSAYDGPRFCLRLWDGWYWDSNTVGKQACTVVLNSPDALVSLIRGADEVSLGEAFLHKELDIEGDLFSAFAVAEHLMRRPRKFRAKICEAMLAKICSASRWLKLGRRHSRDRDQASIAYHYDLPVEFYRPWLGETLAYSCAYFQSPDDSLKRAQKQKLDLICRKLRLKGGEHFLDIGCGWGSLILHAACRYRAISHGITLSSEQAAVATQRIAQAGLEERCTAEHRDYRNCESLRGTFDKIASIGMFEHVGLQNLPAYFSAVRDLLKPGGTFLNHGIARCQSSPIRKRSFIDRYVFPDGRLVTITQAINAAEGAGFEVRDVENLREHYELTLRRWVDGLEQNRDELLKIVPETTYRIWLLYTAGCAAAFRRGDLAIHQVLLSRPDRGCSHLPLLREDWYVKTARNAIASAS